MVNGFHSKINLSPKVCNLCGGKVIYTDNRNIYHGKSYGSGKCYLCTNCGAYVGTHKPRPKEAFGILANSEMRRLKHICHQQFDSFWQGKSNSSKKRKKVYFEMAKILGIPVEECHFGYFDLVMLKKPTKQLSKCRLEEKSCLNDGNQISNYIKIY